MKLGLGFLRPEHSPLMLSPEICGCVEPLMKQLTETRRQQMSGSGKCHGLQDWLVLFLPIAVSVMIARIS
jgi:hypothetical protein